MVFSLVLMKQYTKIYKKEQIYILYVYTVHLITNAFSNTLIYQMKVFLQKERTALLYFEQKKTNEEN